MSKTGGKLDLKKPQMDNEIENDINDMAQNFQDIDDGHSEHLAEETPHETTDTVTNQKYKYGLAVKDGVWGIEKLEVSE